ncbi:MAG: hypothetical protein ABID45_04610 [Patescibacteria group bacterium]
MKKFFLIFLIVLFAFSFNTDFVNAKSFKKLNIKKFIHNTKGVVKLKDKVNITKRLKLNKNLNVKGVIKNTTSGSPVEIDDNLLLQNTIKFSEITAPDTSTLEGGEVYYNQDGNLYLYDGSSWVDLTQQDTDTNFDLESNYTTTNGNILMADGSVWDSAAQTDIISVGTITAGTWQGTALQDAYVADDITASSYFPLAGGTLTGNITFNKISPGIIFNGSTDYDYWVGLGVPSGAGPGGDPDNHFMIGTGTVISNNSVITIDPTSEVGIGTDQPYSKLHVEGYLQIDDSEGAPDAGDCTSNTVGRMILDDSPAVGSHLLYICTDEGWDTATLAD